MALPRGAIPYHITKGIEWGLIAILETKYNVFNDHKLSDGIIRSC